MTTPNPESSPIFAAVEKGDLEQVKALRYKGAR
jgi:hypothetical protein